MAAAINRRPFQGVTNIIRFNWHYYVLAILFIAALLISGFFLPVFFGTAAMIISVTIILSILLSLAVSFYIYDLSDLYSLNWLNVLNIHDNNKLANISAGFDETSALLNAKFPNATLQAFDFYNPANHTEISIERARKAYPAFPGTQKTSTGNSGFKAHSFDYIFLILAAHEIRNREERITFFKQLKEALRPDGKVIVTEHQRDAANFIAYNIGCFHFFSWGEWKWTFAGSGFTIESQFKVTPFITTYILTPDGTAA
jgi:SAM-dependent methyltransferase